MNDDDSFYLQRFCVSQVIVLLIALFYLRAALIMVCLVDTHYIVIYPVLGFELQYCNIVDLIIYIYIYLNKLYIIHIICNTYYLYYI